MSYKFVKILKYLLTYQKTFLEKCPVQSRETVLVTDLPNYSTVAIRFRKIRREKCYHRYFLRFLSTTAGTQNSCYREYVLCMREYFKKNYIPQFAMSAEKLLFCNNVSYMYVFTIFLFQLVSLYYIYIFLYLISD